MLVISPQEYVSRRSNIHESALTLLQPPVVSQWSEVIWEIVCKSRCTCMKRLYGAAYPFVKKGLVTVVFTAEKTKKMCLDVLLAARWLSGDSKWIS